MKKIDLGREVNELLENEAFRFGNFYYLRHDDFRRNIWKLSESCNQHNIEQANELKKILSAKYPNIEITTDQIIDIGMRYSKWKKYQYSMEVLENDRKRHQKDMEEFPDWGTSGSYTDVVITHRFDKREEEIEKDFVESPISEIEVIIAASKITPENCDEEIFEYLRKNRWSGSFTNPLIEKIYKMYCTEKENDSEIQQLKAENLELKDAVEKNTTTDEEQKRQIKLLETEKIDLEQSLARSEANNKAINEENQTLKTNMKKLQEMLSKVLNFCEYVKNSTLGKLFFKKQIEKIPNVDRNEVELEK